MIADYETCSDDSLLAEWKSVGLDVPEELVQETLKWGGRMLPHLGPLIADPAAWTDWENPSAWAPPHALMLLCLIGGPGIVPYVTAFLRHGEGGDWMSEDGANLVHAAGPEGLLPICEVIGDPGADAYGRWAAVDGLCMLGLEKEEHRPRITQALLTAAKALLEKPEEIFMEDDAVVLTQLGQALAALHDGPSIRLSEQAFAAGRWDSGFASLSDLRKDFQTLFEESLARFRKDPMHHFSRDELDRLKALEAGLETPRDRRMSSVMDTWELLDRMAERVVGGSTPPYPLPMSSEGDADAPLTASRNAPCPCGSGRKFKRCCGASATT